MTKSLIQRTVSLGLAACFTLAMLGSVNLLAQRDEAPAQWANKAAPRA